MNEKLVTSLKLSKELKELGCKQESEFYWGIGGDKCEDEWTLLWDNDDSWSARERVSAFFSGELGEMLPEGYDCVKGEDGKWRSGILEGELEDNEIDLVWQGFLGVAETEAETKGKMLAYLKKNNLLTQLKQ